MRKLKSNEATGGEIPAEFYKYTPKARDVLIAMIQDIWLTEIPIKEWLECKITLIHKAGEAPKQLPTNRIVDNRRKTAKHHHHEQN